MTEAGFGADLGAEKFVDIKCRKAGLTPSCAVIVATVRALKYHGGVEVADVGKENLAALEKGLVNLERHIHNVRNQYGLAVRRRDQPPRRGHRGRGQRCCRSGSSHLDVKIIVAKHFAEGGKGAVELAKEVVRAVRAA